MRPIIVVGGGVAGCAAALGLHRAGRPVEVWERHPVSTEDVGAFLTLASGAVLALDSLGALDAVDAAARRLGKRRHQDLAGNTELVADLGVYDSTGQAPAAFRYLPRATLCRALQECVAERGIPVHRGRAAASVSGVAGDATVVDDAGRVTATDLVVAADGLRSTLRAALDPDGPPPRYVGQRVLYGWNPRSHHGVAHDFHSIDGPPAFGYIPTDAGTWWFARLTGPPFDEDVRIDPPYDEVAGPWLTGLPAAIAGGSARLWALNGYDLPRVSRWSGDGMLLVGDAAHAASPATGQGASLALEDGVVLGKALRDHRDPAHALPVYERARRDRVQASIVTSARLGVPDMPLTGVAEGRQPTRDELAAQLDWRRGL